MADVIFNGSSSRKPVGQAAIELFFDNSDGRLGGEYAGYPGCQCPRSSEGQVAKLGPDQGDGDQGERKRPFEPEEGGATDGTQHGVARRSLA
jgi:hypothetical protein